MSEGPSSYVDAKKYFSNKDIYQSPYNIFLTRYSSPYRIVTTTTLATIGGGLYGIAWAIFHDQSKAKYFLRCGAGTLCFSFCYAILNEIANGVIMRKANKEQFFASNTAAAIITLGGIHLFQKTVQKVESKPSIARAFKYSWTLCIFNMYLETLIIDQRSFYLGREERKSLVTQFSLVQSPDEARKSMITRRPIEENKNE